MTAVDALSYFQSMREPISTIYADGDDYSEQHGVDGLDWPSLERISRLRFVRVDLASETLMWEAPTDEDLKDNRFVALETSELRAARLADLIRHTTTRDVMPLLDRFTDTRRLSLHPLGTASVH